MKKEITVCHLSSVHPYFDTRILYKECKSLAEEGYRVRLVARKKDGQATSIDGTDVVPFREYKNRFLRVLFSPFKMLSTARKQKARIYHFHDPELLPVGVLLKLLRKKVIYDVHEDYSKQLLYKPWMKSRWIKKLLALGFRCVEVVSVLFFDRVIAATPDIAKRFPARKTVIVRNVPILNLICSAVPAKVEKKKPVIIYAGALAEIRGAREIIRSMEYIEQDAELWLLGKWDNEPFRLDCERQEGWKKVKYLGFKKPHEVYEYMKAADIALAVLHPIKNYLTSLPVKAFEYLACSVPMIMSDFSFWQEMFADCALFANPLDPEEIGKKINLLMTDKELGQRLAETGKRLVWNEYSWEAEKKHLFNLYRELA
jgi:glycosyltransferase involved in cell wall biosynthesis